MADKEPTKVASGVEIDDEGRIILGPELTEKLKGFGPELARRRPVININCPCTPQM